MSRFLFTVSPFVGHVHGQIPIAQELQRRGHAAAFYTGERFRETLAREGFEVFPYRAVREREIRTQLVGRSQEARVSWWTPRLFVDGIRAWLLGSVPDQVTDLDPLIREWRPDALVMDITMLAPLVVLGEAFDLPVAYSSTLMGCTLPGPDARPFVPWLPRQVSPIVSAAADVLMAAVAVDQLRAVNQLRAAYGLPSLGYGISRFLNHCDLHLIPSVPELDYDRRDLPEWVHYVGPCVWNQTAGDALPAWFDALPADQPVVHVTEGTAHHEGPFLLRAAACGLSTRTLQIVATTGPERDPETLDVGPRPANLHLERWLPHSRLLPHCAAVVTTGGAGTIMAALSFGVPLVVVPSHWDKTDNARRVEASGAGIYLPPGKCTPERLAEAVDRVLTEPRFKARAAELANRLALTPGPKGAATLLEQLVCHSVREQQTLVVQGASR